MIVIYAKFKHGIWEKKLIREWKYDYSQLNSLDL